VAWAHDLEVVGSYLIRPIAKKSDLFPGSIKSSKKIQGANVAQNLSGYLVITNDFSVLEAPHNLKVTGSNPVPATKIDPVDLALKPHLPGFSCGNVL
jgi:hypothetical protein